MGLVSDYDYALPEELIAAYPPERRGTSRVLILDRQSGDMVIKAFPDMVEYLSDGDCAVLNNTRVVRARFLGLKEGAGAAVELLLTAPGAGPTEWRALARPGKRLKPGSRVKLTPNGPCAAAERWATVLEKNDSGEMLVRFDGVDMDAVFRDFGHMPLPPYIHRADTPLDAERYQTVFASVPGAVAAPTAGLHFTPEVLDAARSRGVDIVELTLHVGAGTFKPVSVERVEDHRMHAETFALSEGAAERVNACRDRGGKVLAVGTTAARVLETLAGPDGRIRPSAGTTDIYLYPPYRFKAVDRLLTNFHLPKSTLLMLVCAFAGKDRVMDAYRLAIREKLRFYSYGDCMLLL